MRGTIVEFRNNYDPSLTGSQKVINLAASIRERNSYVKIRPIPIKAIMYDHWKDKTKGIEDLKRLLQIADYAKEQGVDIIIKTPKKRFATPFWYYFDSLEVWTSNYFYQSYIESMVATRTVRTHEQWFEPLNNSIKWSTPRIHFLIHLIVEYPEVVLKYGLLRTKDEKIDISLIDIKEIVKYKDKTQKIETLEKLEKEFSKEVKV